MSTPAHDARGNTTTFPQPSDLTATYSATYDAWNRLAFVWVDSNGDGDHDAGETVIARYEYDALNRRTKKHLSADTDDDFDSFKHFYYNAGWQILETRRSEGENTGPETLHPEYQYVWSQRYIDSPVLRDENKDDDCTESGTDERLYYLTDANMNVTALLDTGGDAVERYSCDPYGRVTVYSDDWSTTVDWDDSKKNPVRYCGYFFDSETGLYHVRHRSYHPTLGRWLTRDPIGYTDGMGLYEYAECAPLHWLDPSGLAWIDPTKPTVSTQVAGSGPGGGYTEWSDSGLWKVGRIDLENGHHYWAKGRMEYTISFRWRCDEQYRADIQTGSWSISSNLVNARDEDRGLGVILGTWKTDTVDLEQNPKAVDCPYGKKGADLEVDFTLTWIRYDRLSLGLGFGPVNLGSLDLLEKKREIASKEYECYVRCCCPPARGQLTCKRVKSTVNLRGLPHDHGGEWTNWSPKNPSSGTSETFLEAP